MHVRAKNKNKKKQTEEIVRRKKIMSVQFDTQYLQESNCVNDNTCKTGYKEIT